MKALTLINQTIRQHDGLYSLNDLHQASGGEAKHRPNYFLDNDQTQALIAEISNAGNPAFKTRKGNNGGTYACKELVIAYAAWISAAFHLKVIGVFLDNVQKPQSLPPARQAIESIKAFNALFDWQQKRLHLDENAANIRANQAVRKLCGVDLLALTDNTHLVAENQESRDYTPSELGLRMGGLSGQKVNQLLAAAGLQIKPAKDWIPTDQGKGHFVWHDTGKAHGSGTPVKQLKWHDSVLPIIETFTNQQEAA